MEALQGSVFEHLRDMYYTACQVPDAFKIEYAASTQAALDLIMKAAAAELEGDCVGGDAWGENVLHFAAGCGCMEACELLLRRHPRLNFQQDRKGATALIWAVRHGMVRVVQLLLEHGAEAEHIDARGCTPLFVAASLGYPKICELLLSVQGTNRTVERFNGCGWTALHAAAGSGSMTCCQALVKVAADVNARTLEEDRLPLHLAATAGHLEVVRYLMSVHRSDVHLLVDAYGHRALDVAQRGGHDAVVEVLREPVDDHDMRVEKWTNMMHSAGLLDVQLPGSWMPSLDLAPPELLRVRFDDLELSCLITDLEYRLIEYVVEARSCCGPKSAPPARLYYARMGAQRKMDTVMFRIPRARKSGIPIWCHGGAYQFRVNGRCERSATMPLAPWQVASEWSSPVRVLANGRKLSRSSSPGSTSFLLS